MIFEPLLAILGRCWLFGFFVSEYHPDLTHGHCILYIHLLSQETLYFPGKLVDLIFLLLLGHEVSDCLLILLEVLLVVMPSW